jgi:Tol biopolymer transport system component
MKMCRPFGPSWSPLAASAAPWLIGASALGSATLGSSTLGCQAATPAASPAEAEGTTAAKLPNESHLGALLQLTDSGEKAEAYWAFAGNQLLFQTQDRDGCNQLYTLAADRKLPEARLVSSGKGASAGAYFLPGDREIVYASTSLSGPTCPPRPDSSQGDLWPLPAGFDILRANADGSNPRPLTQQNTYDAEASVCAKDGSIIFTSTRDGDVELYRMDSDGQNVQRLTHAPGYDGRAFFSPDCSRIVWQASRPAGKALTEYQSLLAQGLVRASGLEIHVAKADGTDSRQITYFNAESSAPFFAPSGERVLFSSNVGDPARHEFDIWGINLDGSALEQITYAPGFDGFPMFSPDGKYLAFSSNRASRPGSYDSNVFVAEWIERAPQPASESSADRLMRDIRWLADPAREGRGVGTAGLEAAGGYIEAQFRALGLQPAGSANSYREELEVVTKLDSGPGTQLSLANKALPAADFQALGFSANGDASGKLVLAGYGIQQPELGRKDYDQVTAKGNIVVVRRFVPETEAFRGAKLERTHGDLRQKAWTAREHGAKAMIVVDMPERPAGAAADWAPAEDATFPTLERDSYGDAGLPVVIVKRAAFAPILAQLEKRATVTAKLAVELTQSRQKVFNVLGRLPARAPADQHLPGVFVVGAHYDHLGYGGSFSLAPDDRTPHLGADDNASGVSLVLEVARRLSQSQKTRRDVIFITFTGEEMGILGSSHLIKNPPPGLEPKNIHAMFNFDMVGRLSDNALSVLGAESAEEWKGFVPAVCEQTQLDCRLSGNGYGPSDHSAFYAAGVPVLHFFTGAHSDYHKPTDEASKINGAGVAQIAELTARLLETEAAPGPLAYRRLPPEAPRGDQRSFNASLGTIPDFGGPPNQKGVLLAGVRPGSGADAGGMKAGDILIQVGDRSIESLHDLKFVLDSSKPHQTVKAAVLRDGKRVEMKVTFQEKGGAPAANPHAAPKQNGGKDVPAGTGKPASTGEQKSAPAAAAAPATNPSPAASPK